MSIPLDRWDCDRLLVPGVDANTAGVAGRFGGFLGRWAGFDAAAFGVSPSEAALMDPQQRMLLEVCTQGLNLPAGPSMNMSGQPGCFTTVYAACFRLGGMSLRERLHIDV